MSALVDPKSLTAAELRALENVSSMQLIRTKGGYRNPNGLSVSLKVAERLEHLRLIRAVHDRRRAAWTLVATGLGKVALDIVRERRERRNAQ